MDLLQHIRSERAQQKTKQPFQRGLFERINGLVKEYSLGENFLKRLDDSATSLPAESLRASAKAFGRPKAKVPFEPPLFSLSTEEEYRVTTAIIKKVNNPYLRFVHSPDEILLCEPLFRRNPSLDPDKLARYHFETLLLTV